MMMWFWVVVVFAAVVALGALTWWSSGRAKPDMISQRASDLRDAHGEGVGRYTGIPAISRQNVRP